MRKNVFIFLVIFLVTILLSCDDTTNDPRVRITTDEEVSVTYGIKFGDAVFGPIGPGETTGYDDTEEGSHHIYVMNESGEWIQALDEKMGPVEATGESTGKYNKYTITVSPWVVENYFYFSISED